MKRTLPVIVANYLKAHVQKKRWKQIVSVLACIVVFCTTYALILPAITMTGAYCGQEEHTHSVEAGCYTEGEAHVHTEDCYQEERVLTCGLAETEGHTHDDSCYDEEGNLICEQEEAEAHTHTEDCYTVQKTLVCGKEEGEAESVLTCPKEEHTHTLACYSDPNADLDEPRIPKLSGDAAADAALIAQKQLGYAQSTRNYLVAADGETKYGYTCYGAAYGDSYTPNWSALFARFCLDKAGVSENFPRASTCDLWISMLTEQELYQDAADYTPKTGDVAFFDLDGDGVADHAGIVLHDETAAVGNVDGIVAKEALTDAVGFGTLPVKSPVKAADALSNSPLADTLQISVKTTQGSMHTPLVDDDGAYLYYTGESAKTTLEISNPTSSEVTEDDGAVVRLYFRFHKTVPQTGAASTDGFLEDFEEKDYTITTGNGHTYTYKVRRIDTENSNVYTYCIEVARPLNGDTMSIDISSVYPSMSSAGGEAEVWGVILDAEQRAAATTVDADGTETPLVVDDPAAASSMTDRQALKWVTEAGTFTTSYSWRLPLDYNESSYTYKMSIFGDGDGNVNICNVAFGGSTRFSYPGSGYGEDPVKRLTYAYVLKKPENADFSEELKEAVAGSYTISTGSHQSSWQGFNSLILVGENEHVITTLLTYQRSGFSDYQDFLQKQYGLTLDTDSVQVSFTETGDLQIRLPFDVTDTEVFTKNGAPYMQIGYLESNEGSIRIPEPEAGKTYTVQSDVTVTAEYSWSAPQKLERSAKQSVTAEQGELVLSKTAGSNVDCDSMLARYQFVLSLQNKSITPMPADMVEDPIPPLYYLQPSDLVRLFQYQPQGAKLTVTIHHGTICDAIEQQTVYAINGKTTSQPGLTQSSTTESLSKYSGLHDTDPTERTREATLTITSGNDGAGLIITRSAAGDGVEEKSVPCGLTEASIQSALTELGFRNNSQTQYVCTWDFRDENGDPRILKPGETVYLCQGGGFAWVTAMAKNSFMMLDTDYDYEYPDVLKNQTNTAYAYLLDEDGSRTQIAEASFKWQKKVVQDFTLSKTAASPSGDALSYAPSPGKRIVYTVDVNTVPTSYIQYNEITPLTDHLGSGQTLLAEVSKNQKAAWVTEYDPEIYTDESGVQYYKLQAAGEYHGVWLGSKYADSVTVYEDAGKRDTLIKWYFFPRTSAFDTGRHRLFTYQVLVDEDQLDITGLNYTLSNESYLGDHESHRLHTAMKLDGQLLSFDKSIVSAKDVGAAQKAEGEKSAALHEGETLYYRLTLENPAKDGTLTLTGNMLRDQLPLGLTQDGETCLQWHVSKQEEPGAVWIVGYEGAQELKNGDAYHIAADSAAADQQELIWDDSFSVTIGEDPLYIYVRLTYPTGTAWDSYAGAYTETELTNTFFVNGFSSSVEHQVAISAKAYLQKSVIQNCSNGYTGIYPNGEESGFFYHNQDAYDRRVKYNIALVNTGTTRLYLQDMQDILPEGFRFYSMDNGGHNIYNTQPSSECTTIQPEYVYLTDPALNVNTAWRDVWVVSKTATVGTTQRVTFSFEYNSNVSKTLGIHYDEQRKLCYLEPGEGIQFNYFCSVDEYSKTQDTAVNSIAMPYYDYNGGGVSLDSSGLEWNPRDVSYSNLGKNQLLNGGTNSLKTNAEMVADGRTGVDDDTQWLYSEVQQIRGETRPGIAKSVYAKIDKDGNVSQSVKTVSPTDTVRWKIDVYNDGGETLRDYVVTDVVDQPYIFNGDVRASFVTASSSTDVQLFHIGDLEDGKVPLTTSYGTTKLTLGGDTVELKISSSQTIQVRMGQNEDGKYVLAIRFPSRYASVPKDRTVSVYIDTKPLGGNLVNTVFVNSAYVTPMSQDWDGTTNHGRVTMLDAWDDGDSRMSVRASAPVITSYGYATSSDKTVSVSDGEKTFTASSNASPNYVVMPNGVKQLTYTLSVYNSDIPLSKLIMIDGLPDIGDHTAFQNDDPRFSDFKISLADDPNFSVTVTREDKTSFTLTPEQYTIEYSTKTEFDKNDWNGSSAWSSDPTGARSFRLKIIDDWTDKTEDEYLMPKNSQISLRFDARIDGDPQPGETAWNSFGYHYAANSSAELEAAPLAVGVMMPTRPYLQKSLVDRDGKSTTAKKEETFRFLLYSGQSLKTTDVVKIVAEGRAVSIIDLTVPQGASASEKLMLKALKVWDYADGQWTQTDTDWTWTHNGYYTLVELPQSDDPEYRFQSLNRRTDETGYQFVYQYDQTQQISAVNLHDVWPLTIRKVDQANPDITIAGAWFALYSPYESDMLDYDALAEKPTNKPADKIEQDGKTWYLTRVAQTGNVESERGSLTWSDLRRETYLYQEIQSPKGYMLDPTIRTVTKNGNPQTVTVTNEGAGYELPQTGGPGQLPFVLSGLLLIGGTALVLCRRRKRKGAA